MLVKNKDKYVYKTVALNEDVFGRLQFYKKVYGKHNISDTLKAILDEWEYEVPITHGKGGK